MRNGSTKGFTLIELLIVIAIIAMLVSILLPSLSRAKEQARTAVCLANLKGVGSAMSGYAARQNDALPPDRITRAGERMYWVHLLTETGSIEDYSQDDYAIPDQPSALRCPNEITKLFQYGDYAPDWGIGRSKAFRDNPGRATVIDLEWLDRNGDTVYYVHTSYAINGGNTESKLFAWPKQPPHKRVGGICGDDVVRTSEFINSPSRVMSVHDGAYTHMSGHDGIHVRHNFGTLVNILFCDGRAGAFQSSEIPSTWRKDEEDYDDYEITPWFKR
jgi:prepilin-type N-terminal cleavage/methylation domain-containing protein/prepilin-type processing-associated H-X9-DG protein